MPGINRNGTHALAYEFQDQITYELLHCHKDRRSAYVGEWTSKRDHDGCSGIHTICHIVPI
ncbi:hypothetical protein M404DRAFT_999941 [Pisolithus tinctorius Marx 270]|uniref:Uncharacterized protein n=1 Tax=Pisolithus tinctorius Marx 270 TaxID=870435 RepID=A0A0C3K6Y4_PISTI|nr:hypothetical protein M404DRAFT_999941 [Pisolithus tinctorius Marx 270]